jgi:integrase/recombinase XerD
MPDISITRHHNTADKERVPTDLDTLVQGYQLCARTEGKSPGTIALNLTALRLLREFLLTAGIPPDIDCIGVSEIRHFILHLQQLKAFAGHPTVSPRSHGLSGHSVNSYLRGISAFWSWLVSEEITSHNPFDRVKIPRPPKKLIPTYTETQIQSLIGAIDRSTSPGVRDWAMVLTLLDTGVRVSELVGMAVKDVDLEGGMLKVFGKGAKERLVPVGARVQRLLWKYLNQYRPEPESPRSDYLFLTKCGRPLTRTHVGNVFRRHSTRAGLGIVVAPHRLRHTFAMSYLRNGGDVFSLQRILGHSSLDAVRVYVNMAQSDIKAAHRRYSPVDNLSLRVPGNKRTRVATPL